MHRGGLAAVAALLLGVACRGDEITTVRVPREAAAKATAPAAPPAAGTARAGGESLPPPPALNGAAKLRWTLPEGWTQGAGKDAMRFATLKPPAGGRVAGSVVVLSGPAGGELANVNRWRQQLGLPVIDPDALPGLRRMVTSRMGPVAVYDFANEAPDRMRLIAAIAPAGDHTWFVKLAGDADAVGAAREDFLRLLESLHLGSDR